MLEEMKNMILNSNYENNTDIFSHMMTAIPYKYHFKLLHIHNVEFRSTWSLPLRVLDDYVLVYIRHGNGHYIINGKNIPFKAGYVFLISPNTPFSAIGDDLTPSLLSIRFHLCSNTTNKPLTDYEPFYTYYDTKDNEQYRNLFYDTYSTYLTDNCPVSGNALISLLLSRLLKDLQSIIIKSPSDLRLESARVYVEKNIKDEITVQKLADIARLSVPYFSKIFKQQYGISPKSYIYNAKMRYAKVLLTEYYYSVKETANALHYSDMFIFSNQYKNYWGCSPSLSRNLRV